MSERRRPVAFHFVWVSDLPWPSVGSTTYSPLIPGGAGMVNFSSQCLVYLPLLNFQLTSIKLLIFLTRSPSTSLILFLVNRRMASKIKNPLGSWNPLLTFNQSTSLPGSVGYKCRLRLSATAVTKQPEPFMLYADFPRGLFPHRESPCLNPIVFSLSE